jgi:hypothetical protein
MTNSSSQGDRAQAEISLMLSHIAGLHGRQSSFASADEIVEPGAFVAYPVRIRRRDLSRGFYESIVTDDALEDPESSTAAPHRSGQFLPAGTVLRQAWSSQGMTGVRWIAVGTPDEPLPPATAFLHKQELDSVPEGYANIVVQPSPPDALQVLWAASESQAKQAIGELYVLLDRLLPLMNARLRLTSSPEDAWDETKLEFLYEGKSYLRMIGWGELRDTSHGKTQENMRSNIVKALHGLLNNVRRASYMPTPGLLPLEREDGTTLVDGVEDLPPADFSDDGSDLSVINDVELSVVAARFHEAVGPLGWTRESCELLLLCSSADVRPALNKAKASDPLLLRALEVMSKGTWKGKLTVATLPHIHDSLIEILTDHGSGYAPIEQIRARFVDMMGYELT